MNPFLSLYARTYQGIMWLATHFLDFSEPNITSKQNAIKQIPSILLEKKKSHPLIVTDSQLFKLGLLNPLFEELKNQGMEYSIYNGVNPNPTIDNVEEGLNIYLEGNCDSIIAFGGGSSMDCAKVIGVRVNNPKIPVNKLKGVLKVKKKPVFLIAVPTTAGTGSEATVAAVIVDKVKDDKYAINDPKLIPPAAVLDPSLLVGLPKHISATTGMDALTHAVEAYIGHSNTKKTKLMAIDAIRLVFTYLLKSVQEPTNLLYREKMQKASYEAGVAFTRAYVGSVHAIAHALGGKYNVPHGLANAVILPIVLKFYGKSAYKKLAQLYDVIGLSGANNQKEKALKFIDEIVKLNEKLDIRNNFGHLIQDNDIPFLVNHAYKEAVPLYPTPRILNKKELEEIYEILQKQ